MRSIVLILSLASLIGCTMNVAQMRYGGSRASHRIYEVSCDRLDCSEIATDACQGGWSVVLDSSTSTDRFHMWVECGR